MLKRSGNETFVIDLRDGAVSLTMKESPRRDLQV